MRSEEGVSGAMRDTHTGKVQAHPCPKALPSLGVHTFPSGLTTKIIQQAKRRGTPPQPQLRKVSLREVEDPATLVRRLVFSL